MIYAFIIILFVIFISAFTLKLCAYGNDKKTGFIVLPVSTYDHKEAKRIAKEIYYEEMLYGFSNARHIIMIDTEQRKELAEFSDEFDMIDYILISELEEYIKKEMTNEQKAIR